MDNRTLEQKFADGDKWAMVTAALFFGGVAIGMAIDSILFFIVCGIIAQFTWVAALRYTKF